MNYLFTLKSRVILFSLLICQLGLKVQSTAEIKTKNISVHKIDTVLAKKLDTAVKLKTDTTLVIKAGATILKGANTTLVITGDSAPPKKTKAAKKSHAITPAKKLDATSEAKTSSSIVVNPIAGQVKNTNTIIAPPTDGLIQVRTPTTIAPPTDGLIEVRNTAPFLTGRTDTAKVKNTDTATRTKSDTTLAKKGDTTLLKKPDTSLVKKSDTTLLKKPDTSLVKKSDTTLMRKDTTTAASEIKAQGVFLEIGGPGLAISGNYDARFGKQRNGWGYRIGAGYFGSGGNTVFTVPFQINYLYGEHSHLLELGAGTTFLNSRGDNKGKTWEFDKITGFIATATIGYRYQPAKSGLNFRIAFVPILYDQGIMPIGGASVGYTFK
jgi:hypothetical protein